MVLELLDVDEQREDPGPKLTSDTKICSEYGPDVNSGVSQLVLTIQWNIMWPELTDTCSNSNKP